MFVTAVSIFFLFELKWPKNTSFYDTGYTFFTHISACIRACYVKCEHFTKISNGYTNRVRSSYETSGQAQMRLQER